MISAEDLATIEDTVRRAVREELAAADGNKGKRRKRKLTIAVPAVRPSLAAQRKACADFGLVPTGKRATRGG